MTTWTSGQRLLRLAFLVLGLFAGSASAQQAPAYIPVQGSLAADDGTAKDGAFVFEVRLYELATGGTAFYAESQQVTVTDGLFTMYVGDGSPADLGDGTTSPALDLTVFNARPQGVVFLGLSVDGAAELSPRLQLGSVPYAGFAQTCSDSKMLDGQGASAFALTGHKHTAAEVGAAPADHTHTAAAVGAAPASHTHTAASVGAAPASAGVPSGAVMFFTGSSCPSGWSPLTQANGRAIVARTDGQGSGQTVGTALGNLENRTHSHVADPPATATVPSASGADGSHDHIWSVVPGSVGGWGTWDHGGTNGSSRGIAIGTPETAAPAAGTGFLPLGVTKAARKDFYTTKTSHSHNIDQPAFTTGSTAGTLPYVQLLACSKD